MGKDFWTEYYYKAPDGKVTNIVERDFSVLGPAGGRASIMGGYESHEVSTETELEEVRQGLLVNIRPWYAWTDRWEIVLAKDYLEFDEPK